MGKKNKKSKNKRMAGELWRTYDAASRGSASFDKDDIKHLTKEGWSVDDIRKAALAANHISNTADKQLRVLGTPDSKYFQMRGAKGMAEYMFGGTFTDKPLQWNGRDGEGRGLAIGGGPAGKASKEPFQKSWALPEDFIEERRAADFAKRMAEWNAANPPKQAEQPKATPVAASPVPAFDPSEYAVFSPKANTDFSAVSSGDSGGSVAPPSWQGPTSYAVNPVPPPAPPGSESSDGVPEGYLGGYESFINRRYARPINWKGDVWG